MSTKQYLFLTLFLLGACIGSWLLLTAIENRSLPLTNANHPDSFMRDVLATNIDELGQLKDKLQAPLMVHFAVGDTTNITSPHFILYNSDNTGQPWHIYSNKGQARNGINILYLWDHVRLEQPAGANNPSTVMLTSAMTVFPKEQYAQTDQPVKVWQAGSVVTAVGLRANLKTGNIDLLSKTQGKYLPKPTSTN